ncbi:MAG: class II fumarate hydratase [Opitutales bacterium]|nr:class II fumarate hydratase [Opitutales bacterium]
MRVEHDTLGAVEVPSGKYWGAQTQRSIENFPIGPSASMPVEIIRAFAVLKKAAALTNLKLGVISSEKAQLIARVCDEILSGSLDAHFPLVIWQTGSGTQSNMNVNEVIANRAHVLLGNRLGEGHLLVHPNDDVNKSQSSNDTFPTAMHIAAYKVLVERTIPAVERLVETLEAKSRQMWQVVKIGRTHWMDATPLTLGQEFSGYVSQLRHGLRALRNTLPHMLELALGGTAVGTGLNAPRGYAELVAGEIAALSGHPFVTAENKFESLAAHDAFVESHGALKQLAVSLTKIANDIRLLASGPRSGIGEITIPANEPGSSIMPGKVNPTQVEALTMVCAQVLGHDVTITIGGASGQFELNVFKPVIIANFLQSANLLADACSSFNERCVVGIEPNMSRIDEHLRNSLMLVTALNTHIGYESAAKIAKKAHAENTSLREAALALGLVSEAQFDEWVVPVRMTGLEPELKS